MTKEIHIEKVARFFRAFSDPTRLKILLLLLEQNEMCVNKIVESLGMSQPAISQQMQLLNNLGIVKKKRDGQFIRYSIADDFVKEFIKIVIKQISGGKDEL
ncbi:MULTISPECIES: ArsR/SmtB family transcription factor [Caldisericum]|jgi:ArsR family transcriptional regulator|uniref:Transcriptional regulator n=1 Tax=Caldisericum exile TaxID=693075 RepID=A0A2J6WFC6_9BACT|nr:MAG: transcriptional regulator [Caldisericum exile]